MFSLYLVLGLHEGAPTAAVKAAYKRLRQRLNQLDRWQPASLGYVQAQQALLAIEQAYTTLIDANLKSRYDQEWKEHLKRGQDGEIQPKLGQLCVAAGIITLEQLEEAIEKQTMLDFPLGQILQQQRLISQTELDGLLLGQQLIRLPVESPYSLGQRLMALDLVTEDMVRIALIEQRTFGRPMEDLLVAHGWLDGEVLKALLERDDQPAEQPTVAQKKGERKV